MLSTNLTLKKQFTAKHQSHPSGKRMISSSPPPMTECYTILGGGVEEVKIGLKKLLHKIKTKKVNFHTTKNTYKLLLPWPNVHLK